MSKKNSTLESLYRAFQEDVDDKELEQRYESFQKNLEYCKKAHNELVPKINENLESIGLIKESILTLALEGIISKEAILKIKEIDTENSKLITSIKDYKEKIDYNQGLIDKYKTNSDDRLFTWWKAFKAVDPTVKTWIEWKETYKDIII